MSTTELSTDIDAEQHPNIDADARSSIPKEWCEEWDGHPTVSDGTHVCPRCGAPQEIDGFTDDGRVRVEPLACPHGGVVDDGLATDDHPRPDAVYVLPWAGDD